MSDSVFSPDGKFMWTGSEWIPAPPTDHFREPLPSTSQSGDIRDSVIMGDVNRQITQNITYQALYACEWPVYSGWPGNG